MSTFRLRQETRLQIAFELLFKHADHWYTPATLRRYLNRFARDNRVTSTVTVRRHFPAAKTLPQSKLEDFTTLCYFWRLDYIKEYDL